jgi:hypothetical protein
MAARELDAALRKFGWYVSTGVAERGGNAILVVYVKNKRKFSEARVGKNWNGFPVEVRAMHGLRAVTN